MCVHTFALGKERRGHAVLVHRVLSVDPLILGIVVAVVAVVALVRVVAGDRVHVVVSNHAVKGDLVYNVGRVKRAIAIIVLIVDGPIAAGIGRSVAVVGVHVVGVLVVGVVVAAEGNRARVAIALRIVTTSTGATQCPTGTLCRHGRSVLLGLLVRDLLSRPPKRHVAELALEETSTTLDHAARPAHG